MLVLDRVRQFDAATRNIEVGPFHTGHLGLLPGTVVYPSLVHHSDASTSDRAELIVTPFPQSIDNVTRLTCLLRDVPGAVARLADSVAALGINIAIQESGSIDAFQDHAVSMILDWSTAQEFPPVSDATIRRYAAFGRLFPVDEFRYVKLFESIVVGCADVLRWHEVGGSSTPALSIHPIHARPKRTIYNSFSVEASTPRRYQVHITLAQDIYEGLEHRLGSGPWSYLVLSDPQQRALRVLFMSRDFRSSLVHVGFRMKHQPGALAALLRLLEEANFNIVASAHRHLKRQKDQSVWDALVAVPNGHGLANHDPVAAVTDVTRRLQRVSGGNFNAQCQRRAKI